MSGAALFCVVLAGVSVVLSLWAIARDRPLEWRFAVPEPVVPEGKPSFETVLDYALESGQAHSPGIVVEEGGFRILWFEGSAEAQADVDVLGARFERVDGVWRQTETGPYLTRAGLSAAMEPAQIVVTLGNTIENEARAGGLWATVASVGGWAMASIVDVARDGPARRLDLSPVLGRSNLVKSPMVAFADGSLGLPAYFEMGSTFGVLARFDEVGRVRDTRRMAGWGKPIQPMIVPLSETRAVAFLRDFEQSQKLLVSRTEDGGQSWSVVEPRDVFNPSSPVAALGLGDGRILMAMNDLAEAPDVLRLVLSEDEGESWREVRRLKEAGALRYPMLRRLGTGEIVLSYSKGTKQGVVAHMFNQAWVEAT
ncbi:MAG: exo-alpha-sialidase [Pseudomonadota bacterium]